MACGHCTEAHQTSACDEAGQAKCINCLRTDRPHNHSSLLSPCDSLIAAFTSTLERTVSINSPSSHRLYFHAPFNVASFSSHPTSVNGAPSITGQKSYQGQKSHHHSINISKSNNYLVSSWQTRDLAGEGPPQERGLPRNHRPGE